eukprot:COSAG01_NODE_8345_length_2821_cov_11.207568_3_plen_62_part_00
MLLIVYTLLIAVQVTEYLELTFSKNTESRLGQVRCRFCPLRRGGRFCQLRAFLSVESVSVR